MIFDAAANTLPGKHRFTPEELRQVAEYHATSGAEAPIVIGHPAPDCSSPAFGWLKNIRAAGGQLFATPAEVPAQVDQLVKNRQYPKRSTAFLPVGNGKWAIRHLGLLGGTPPAIAGMPDAKFGSESFEDFEYSTPGDTMPETPQDQERNSFIDKLRALLNPEKQKSPEFAVLETRMQGFESQLAARDAEITQLKQQNSEFAASTAKSGTQQRIDSVVNGLKSKGQWLPAFDKMGASEVFAALGASATAEIEFSVGEGDKAKKEKFSPVEMFGSFLGGLSKIVPRGVEFSAADLTPAVVAQPGTTTANVDPASQQFDQVVRARMATDKIDYATAYNRLTAEGKSTANYAAASTGAV